MGIVRAWNNRMCWCFLLPPNLMTGHDHFLKMLKRATKCKKFASFAVFSNNDVSLSSQWTDQKWEPCTKGPYRQSQPEKSIFYFCCSPNSLISVRWYIQILKTAHCDVTKWAITSQKVNGDQVLAPPWWSNLDVGLIFPDFHLKQVIFWLLLEVYLVINHTEMCHCSRKYEK